MALVEGGGVLRLRDAEPYEMTTPTIVSGTLDVSSDDGPGTGAITNGTFSTPQVSIEQDITSPIEATVYIDAVFSQTVPGNLTGSIDDQGHVFVQTALAVDLHIEIDDPPIAVLTSDCRAAPVVLSLVSTDPYDPDTGLVTVATDFTVPEVATSGTCAGLVAGPVNEQLAGAGHSLSLTLQGDLEIPPPPGCASATTLDVGPEGGTRLGEEVTLTAQVALAAGAECDSHVGPTGFVDFRDGTTTLATVALEDGTAELATGSLPAGDRPLRAVYRGGDGVYRGSASPTVTHKVTSNPTITSTLPPAVRIGADPVEFDLTVGNTGMGPVIEHTRVDVTLQWDTVLGTFTPDRVGLEILDDGSWQPVTLTQPAPRVVLGSLNGPSGLPLAPGDETVHRLRISTPGSTPPGPATVTFELVEVDEAGLPGPVAAMGRVPFATYGFGQSPGMLAFGVATTHLVDEDRRPTTVTLGGRGTVPVLPHTVRAGMTLAVQQVQIGGGVSGVNPTGFVEVRIDGRPAPFRSTTTPIDDGYRLQVPRANNLEVPVPVEMGTGIHEITVRYLGDAVFLPSEWTGTFAVVAPRGPAYDCAVRSAANTRFRANLVGQAVLPTAHPAGGSVALASPSLRLVVERSANAPGVASPPTRGWIDGADLDPGLNVAGPDVALRGISVDLGPGGTASATGIERLGTAAMPASPFPAPASAVDQEFVLRGLAGSASIEGSPGDVVPVTVEVIRFEAISNGFPSDTTCTAVDEPLVLGQVVVAGTSLTSSVKGPVRVGDAVTLTATALPASSGVVEFRDGNTTLGVAAVDVEGTATVTTTALAQGRRQVTARFTGGLTVPSTVSNVVEISVLGSLLCPGMASPGHGATVRLVYLELLGRCPDQAGYSYWVARLAGGMSPEAFARTISRMPEAVGVVVDDAYRTMLGRSADRAGKAFWVGRLSGHGRYDALLADLASSAEFWRLAGSSNGGYVDRLYSRLLSRSADADGRAHWVARLEGGTSRAAVARTFAQLDEPLGKVVAGSYGQILDRAPTGDERSSAVTALRADGDRARLYAELIGTDEFTARAQTLPNPGE